MIDQDSYSTTEISKKMDNNWMRIAYEELVEEKLAILKAKLLSLRDGGLGAFNREGVHRMEKYMQLLETSNPAYVLGDEGIKLLLLKKELKIVTLLAAYEAVEEGEMAEHLAFWEIALELEMAIVLNQF